MYHGIINVYKEEGYTSHDVVAKLRRILGQKKIGHTGTLDPSATGVLPVCLGSGTKLCSLLTEKDKTYETVLLLGCCTDTQDVTGQIVSSAPVTIVEEELVPIIESFVGDYLQTPPMYSAIKKNGKKLYELARAGVEIEREARKVVIRSIRILEISLPRVRMEVTCSKGTYIRTLCEDIGKKAGCGGCMEQLIRTQVERFCLSESRTLSEIEELAKAGQLLELILPVDACLSQYPALCTTPAADRLLHNGNAICAEEVQGDTPRETVRFYDSAGRFIGLYAYENARGCYCPVKMFIGRD